MKAIVAEIDKKQMIVITDKGDFIKVKRQMSVGVGDEIELKPRKASLTYRRLAAIAACFISCIFLSTGVYAYYTPYSYVSVDINPSIGLSLNRFERVIAVDPITEDAVTLLEGAKNLKNQDIDAALSTIIKSASEKGYIDAETENQVMVVVSAKDKKQEKELAAVVTNTAAKELAKFNKNSEVMVERASVESYKEAVSHKVSPGKEILADKLREVEPEVKDEEVRNMSVKEVVQRIKEGRKAAMAEERDKEEDDREDRKGRNSDRNGRDEQEDKAAVKAGPKAEGDKKRSEKPKPSAAASKDDKCKDRNKYNNGAAASEISNDGKSRKDDRARAAGVGRDDDREDEDSNKEDEKKKDNDENKGRLNNRSGDTREGNDSKDKGRERLDREKKDGKKGD